LRIHIDGQERNPVDRLVVDFDLQHDALRLEVDGKRQLEAEFRQAVADDLPFVDLDCLQDVRMMTQDQIGSSVDQSAVDGFLISDYSLYPAQPSMGGDDDEIRLGLRSPLSPLPGGEDDGGGRLRRSVRPRRPRAPEIDHDWEKVIAGKRNGGLALDDRRPQGLVDASAAPAWAMPPRRASRAPRVHADP
jgi:hypothetical protein